MSDPLDGAPTAATSPVPPVTPPAAQPAVTPPVAVQPPFDPPVAAQTPVETPVAAQPPVAPPVAPPVFAAPVSSGYGAPAGYDPLTPPTKKTLSLIGMIAGIVGVLGAPVAFFPVIGSIMGLLFPIAAVVLGFLGKRKEGAPAKGLWITAIVTGFVGILIMVIALIGWIALFASGDFQNQLEQMPRS